MTLIYILLGVGGAIWVALTYALKKANLPVTEDMSNDNDPVVPVLFPPQTPPQAPVVPVAPVSKVRLCAGAQQAFEGWYPGSNSYKHNNPGNCKDLSGNFIIFATYEAGFAYLEDYITRVATGKHPAYPKGGNTTIEEYTHTYTSDPEPSATNYAAAISRATGLSTTDKMSLLLS